MKKLIIHTLFFVSIFSFTARAGGNLSLNLPNENYIVSVTPMEASSEIVAETSLVTVNYFDGLGRPTQTVRKGFTPQGNDLVTKIEYDVFGRQHRHSLPVPISNNNGHLVSTSRFQSAVTSHPHHNEGRLFSEIIYEASPLNRVLGNRNPGTAWQNRPTRIAYDANKANEVKHFFINRAGQLQNGGFYNPNTLYKTTAIDEDGKQTILFTDKLGRTIMTRMRSNASVHGNTYHDTYFVYDDFGNLRYMLPPLASDALSSMRVYDDTHEALRHFAFIYKYDERNRQVQKRLPGSDWIYYVYDRADRLVLSQDGNQRERGTWKSIKYDQLGRVLYTAELTISGTHTHLRNEFRNVIATERYNPDFTHTADGSGYTRGYVYAHFRDLPLTMLTVNYYDNYEFLTLPAHNTNRQQLSYTARQGFGVKYENTHGLLTGTRTYILDSSGNYLMEVFYYDYRGRLIQTRATNHIGGFDITYHQLNFIGNVTQSLSMHSSSFAEPITELYTYSYDHAGRLKKTTYRLNDEQQVVLSYNNYDELGRLIRRYRHNGSDADEHFEYNIRNWLTSIQSGGFVQRLYYNEIRPISGHAFNFPLFNGNISAMTWTFGDNLNVNGYSFRYDGMNRLLTTPYAIRNGQLRIDGEMSETFAYDKNGNVIGIRRHDDRDVFSSLSMWYNGNQLRKVTENFRNEPNLYNRKQYQDLADRQTEFYYDANGNMITDWDRHIMTIQYNLLNLPTLIQFRNGSQIRNVYAADGRKLETEFLTAIEAAIAPIAQGETANLSSSQRRRSGTIYAGNKEYTYIEHNWGWGSWTETTLHRIHNPEGYVDFYTNDFIDFMADTRYNYFRRDHLGSVREVWRTPYTVWYWHGSMVWEENHGAETVQRTQYYPSGVPWAEGFGSGFGANNRLYQGKEFIEMHGLDMYDFHWRLYCPFTMRTTTQDPMAEMFPWISPYSWTLNNPVNVIDPDGRIAIPLILAAPWIIKGGKALVATAGALKTTKGALTVSAIATGYTLHQSDITMQDVRNTTTAVASQFEEWVSTGINLADRGQLIEEIGQTPMFNNLGGGENRGGGNPKGGRIGEGMVLGGVVSGTVMTLTNRDPSRNAYEVHREDAMKRFEGSQQPQSQPQSQPQLQPQFQLQPQQNNRLNNNQQDKPIWQLW